MTGYELGYIAHNSEGYYCYVLRNGIERGVPYNRKIIARGCSNPLILAYVMQMTERILISE